MSQAQLIHTSALDLNSFIVQAVLVTLREYVQDPIHPKWSRITSDINARREVPRDLVITKYIIDYATNKPLSPANRQHWRRLFRETRPAVWPRLAEAWAEYANNLDTPLKQRAEPIRDILNEIVQGAVNPYRQ